MDLLTALAQRHGSVLRSNPTLVAALPQALQWALSPDAPASHQRASALGAAHALARASALPEITSLQPMMRRCLCSLPSYVEVQKLCECLGLDAQTAGGAVGGRAVLHARVLGLSVEELTALGEEACEESEAEHEVFAASAAEGA